MIEIWGPDKMLAKSKNPTLETVSGDTIAIRFSGHDVEISYATLKRIIRKALKEDLIFDIKFDDELRKIILSTI